jgi:AraC family transcriptional regulator
MQLELHSEGGRKYPASRLLKSSTDLGWSSFVGELRQHSSGAGPGATAASVEVAVAIKGASRGKVICKVGAQRKVARPTGGAIWLNPASTRADQIEIASPDLKVLHLFLPDAAFARLAGDYNLPRVPTESIRYVSGVHDDVIHKVALSVLTEMKEPSSIGRMMAETSSLFLAARLLRQHAEAQPAAASERSAGRLDAVRLRRVLDYIEQHLGEDISVGDLAEVACLSVFHFTRAFSASVGMPPHAYLSRRRLERAKALLSKGAVSLSQIAFDCGFSSHSSFTRAFRRVVGATPADFRRAVS